MADFQAIALRRYLATVERMLADDHDRASAITDNPGERQLHIGAARSCRARADAYETRADREEARYLTGTCR